MKILSTDRDYLAFDEADEETRAPWLSAWPLMKPGNLVKVVMQPQTESELTAIRRCIQRGSPLGTDPSTNPR